MNLLLLVIIGDKFDLWVIDKVLSQSATWGHSLPIIIFDNQAQILPHKVLEICKFDVRALLQVEELELG